MERNQYRNHHLHIETCKSCSFWRIPIYSTSVSSSYRRGYHSTCSRLLVCTHEFLLVLSCWWRRNRRRGPEMKQKIIDISHSTQQRRRKETRAAEEERFKYYPLGFLLMLNCLTFPSSLLPQIGVRVCGGVTFSLLIAGFFPSRTVVVPFVSAELH